MGCFGPFSVAGFMAGITAVACMTAVVFFSCGEQNGLSLQKQTHTKITISGSVYGGPGRVRLRVGLDFKCLFQL